MRELLTVRVGDYNILNENLSHLIDFLKQQVESSLTTTIVTINPEIFLSSINNEQHGQAIKTADLIVPDGVGVVWAAEYYNCRYKSKFIKFFSSWFKLFFKNDHLLINQRITGVDLTLKLCEENILPVKILGSRMGSGRLAKEKLLQMFPNLKVDVYEDVEVDNHGQIIFMAENDILKEKCLLLLALGAPKQELLMKNLKSQLIPGTIVIGVGGTVDFISGKSVRAPMLIRNMGLEWLFRLVTEPKRILRILNAIIVFPYYILKKY